MRSFMLPRIYPVLTAVLRETWEAQKKVLTSSRRTEWAMVSSWRRRTRAAIIPRCRIFELQMDSDSELNAIHLKCRMVDDSPHPSLPFPALIYRVIVLDRGKSCLHSYVSNLLGDEGNAMYVDANVVNVMLVHADTRRR